MDLRDLKDLGPCGLVPLGVFVFIVGVAVGNQDPIAYGDDARNLMIAGIAIAFFGIGWFCVLARDACKRNF